MKEIIGHAAYFGVAVSLAGYAVGLWIKKKVKKPFANPLLIAILLVMGALVVLGIDYDVYNESAKYLSYLLTPATVCLAIPLYQQLELLKKHWKAVIGGLVAGVASSLVSVLGLSVLFHLTHEQYVSLLPKSITTAIGMGLSEELGGIVTLTVASIILTGVLGAVIGEAVCRLFRIKNRVAVGLAFGASAHAVGTSRALEIGEVEGAMSSLAIAVSGLITVAVASFFVGFY
ncbi:MAG: LrgB family protein [Clostridia bacterium]|nr:LrgB family protein [Clostridia bacterium]